MKHISLFVADYIEHSGYADLATSLGNCLIRKAYGKDYFVKRLLEIENNIFGENLIYHDLYETDKDKLIGFKDFEKDLMTVIFLLYREFLKMRKAPIINDNVIMYVLHEYFDYGKTSAHLFKQMINKIIPLTIEELGNKNARLILEKKNGVIRNAIGGTCLTYTHYKLENEAGTKFYYEFHGPPLMFQDAERFLREIKLNGERWIGE